MLAFRADPGTMVINPAGASVSTRSPFFVNPIPPSAANLALMADDDTANGLPAATVALNNSKRSALRRFAVSSNGIVVGETTMGNIEPNRSLLFTHVRASQAQGMALSAKYSSTPPSIVVAGSPATPGAAYPGQSFGMYDQLNRVVTAGDVGDIFSILAGVPRGLIDDTKTTLISQSLGAPATVRGDDLAALIPLEAEGSVVVQIILYVLSSALTSATLTYNQLSVVARVACPAGWAGVRSASMGFTIGSWTQNNQSAADPFVQYVRLTGVRGEPGALKQVVAAVEADPTAQAIAGPITAVDPATEALFPTLQNATTFSYGEPTNPWRFTEVMVSESYAVPKLPFIPASWPAPHPSCSDDRTVNVFEAVVMGGVEFASAIQATTMNMPTSGALISPGTPPTYDTLAFDWTLGTLFNAQGVVPTPAQAAMAQQLVTTTILPTSLSAPTAPGSILADLALNSQATQAGQVLGNMQFVTADPASNRAAQTFSQIEAKALGRVGNIYHVFRSSHQPTPPLPYGVVILTGSVGLPTCSVNNSVSQVTGISPAQARLAFWAGAALVSGDPAITIDQYMPAVLGTNTYANYVTMRATELVVPAVVNMRTATGLYPNLVAESANSVFDEESLFEYSAVLPNLLTPNALAAFRLTQAAANRTSLNKFAVAAMLMGGIQ